MNHVKRKARYKALRPIFLLTLLYTIIYGKGNALLALSLMLPSFFAEKSTSVPFCLGVEAACLLVTSLLLLFFDLFTIRAWMLCLLMGVACFWCGKWVQNYIADKQGKMLYALVRMLAFGGIMSLMRF